MARWWMSFADEKGNLGVSIVDAEDPKEAIKKAWKLGINPGGSVNMYEIDPRKFDVVDRALTREEIFKFGQREKGCNCPMCREGGMTWWERLHYGRLSYIHDEGRGKWMATWLAVVDLFRGGNHQ